MKKVLEHQINKNNMDSYLLLDYMKSYGFNPDNYSNILELYKSPKESISQFISGDITFLLSRSVNYVELKKYNLEGAFGYINRNGVYIPKSLKNDDIFFHNKTLSSINKLEYGIPSILEFDAIICNGYFKSLNNLILFDIEKYIGFCSDIDSKETKEMLELYKELFILFENVDKDKYAFEHDTLYSEGKELCLIRQK